MSNTNTTAVTNLKSNVKELNAMIQQGKILEAFDKFYSDDIVMQENKEEPRRGREANREYEEQFVNMVEEFHKADITNVAFNEADGVAMVEWDMEMTFKGGQRARRAQVCVQKWENDKIVHERFYYKD